MNPCELCKDIPDGTMTSGCADWFQGMGQVAKLENIYAAGKDICMWSSMEVATAGREHSGIKVGTLPKRIILSRWKFSAFFLPKSKKNVGKTSVCEPFFTIFS